MIFKSLSCKKVHDNKEFSCKNSKPQEWIRNHNPLIRTLEVFTDFNPLEYIKTSCKVNAKGQHWVNELASFNFSIHYKPGA